MTACGLPNWVLNPTFRWRAATAVAVTLHFLLLLWLGLSRQWGHLASLNDLGMFDQAVWGTLHGDWFLNTNNPFGAPINWLGFHYNPVLLGFVPLYALSPAPEWFAIAQALALSLAAWPIWLVAHRLLRSEAAAFLWTLAYLTNPFVLNAGAWDFHPVTLAVPLLTLGLYSIVARRAWLFGGCCLFLLLVQEQMGLTVAGLGLLWAWQQRRVPAWRLGAALASLGVAHMLIVVGVLMPMLSPAGEHVMLSSNLGQLSRYSWLGDSFSSVLHSLFVRPLWVLETALIGMNGWEYLLRTLVPVLGLPLLAPLVLLPAAADLAANLLSANQMPRAMASYHSCTIAAVTVVAAIVGARRLCGSGRALSPTQLAGLVLLASCVAGYRLAPLPLPLAANWWQPLHLFTAPDPVVNRMRDLVGTEASLSVQANIGPHFSQRREVYAFPAKIDRVDAVILHLASPTRRMLPPGREHLGSLSHHLQMSTHEYLTTVDCMLASDEFGIQAWEPPWLVLSRHAPHDAALSAEVRAALAALPVIWHVPDVALPASCPPR